jgi:hypothetical protein
MFYMIANDVSGNRIKYVLYDCKRRFRKPHPGVGYARTFFGNTLETLHYFHYFYF